MLFNRLDQIERYDGTTWTTLSNKLTSPRDGHCSVAIRLNKFFDFFVSQKSRLVSIFEIYEKSSLFMKCSFYFYFFEYAVHAMSYLLNVLSMQWSYLLNAVYTYTLLVCLGCSDLCLYVSKKRQTAEPFRPTLFVGQGRFMDDRLSKNLPLTKFDMI